MAEHQPTNDGKSQSNVQSTVLLAVSALLFLIFLITLASNLIPSLVLSNQATGDDAAVDARIQPVAKVELASSAASGAGAAKAPRTGEELVNSVCSACHGTGAAGSPKIGDKAAWAPRIAKGLDALVKSATAGKNAMPPKGGSDASELELTRAIVYMADKSGANFKSK
ncbi:cytochrome c-555 precursor [mine drainage metagenome]|uniref:Cytochrome c-555 n=1 Tax=mine drainage metagenome TaxID=410659 RepID=A0A1J5S064_9ZZZZ